VIVKVPHKREQRLAVSQRLVQVGSGHKLLCVFGAVLAGQKVGQRFNESSHLLSRKLGRVHLVVQRHIVEHVPVVWTELGRLVLGFNICPIYAFRGSADINRRPDWRWSRNAVDLVMWMCEVKQNSGIHLSIPSIIIVHDSQFIIIENLLSESKEMQ
jgi:hypothetical protein